MNELKARRESLGITLYKLAKLTGIAQSTLHRWEQIDTEIKVTIKQQKALMEALQLESEEELAILLNQSV